MKICKACSAYNRSDRTHCVDCGERLGAPLSEEESAALTQEIQAKTERFWNRQDPTHINGFDVVVGSLHGVGLLIGLLLWVLGQVQADRVETVFGGLVTFFVGVLMCFVPGLLHEVEAWRRSFYTHDTEPLISAVLVRRIFEVVAFAAGIALVLWAVLG